MSGLVPLVSNRLLRGLSRLTGIRGGIIGFDADGWPRILQPGAEGEVIAYDPAAPLGLSPSSGGGGGGGTPSGTVVAETTYGASASAGVAATYSRGDHTHGTPALPTPGDIGAAPTSRTLTGTAPIRIDGGASGTLAADRTISVQDATESAVGVVRLAADGETTTGRVVQAQDSRLKQSMTLVFEWTGSTSSTWTNQPAAMTEWRGLTVHRHRADISGMVSVELRVMVGTTAPVSGSVVGLQVSDDDSTWRNVDVGSGSSSAIDSGARISQSPWSTGTAYSSGRIALHANNVGDKYFRIVASGGDGVVDPVWRHVVAVFYPYI